MGDDTGAVPIRLGPEEGTTLPNPVGGPMTFKASGEETGGTVFAFVSIVDPGEGPPLHVHVEQEEVLYVLQGEMRFKVHGELSPAPAGTFVFVPRGVPHTWQNLGPAQARLLVVFTPAGEMSGFFQSFAELEEFSAEAFARLGREAGMEVVGPPLAVSDPV